MMRIPVWLVLCWSLIGCTQLGQKTEDQAQDPGDIYYQLGVGYLQSGHRQFAQEYLRRAENLRPDHADTQTALGVLYEDIGEAAISRQHYQRAYELAPNNPAALNNYAKGLCDDGSYAEADALFMQAAVDPFYQSPEVAWVGAAICAQRVPDVVKAEHHLRSALERNPRYALALYRLAELLYDQEKYLPARALMQRYAESSAQVAATLWLAAHIECKLSDRNALASLQLALVKRFPDSAQTRLLMEHKDYDLCKTTYRF